MARKYAAIAVIITWVFACGPAAAQGTAFSYQGFLTDNGIPAHGSYDLQFSLFSSSNGGMPLTAPVLTDDLNITNGLFTVALDFGAGQFTGAERWVEISMRPGASTDSYTTLLPRQPITPVPYAIFSGSVSATGITGTIQAGNIGNGTITSNMLAPGAAAANLAAIGQAAVPGGAMVLSPNPIASNLIALGYAPIGGQVDLSWQQRGATMAPSARIGHTAVWTGSKMIIWGGGPNTGAVFDPASNTWSPMTTNNAPSARTYHTAIWTGSEMIVWGGTLDNSFLNDGARYNPASNSWTAIASGGAPSGRYDHLAVWTGSEMIVWGGYTTVPGKAIYLNDGRRYNPTTGNWASMTASNAPAGRSMSTAIWTGNQMIVWGGLSSSGIYPYNFTNYSDGGLYSPVTDTWTAVNTNGAPAGRNWHTAVWTSTEMIVWGGRSNNPTTGSTDIADGGRYSPAMDSWSPVTSNGAPVVGELQTAVWTGSELIAWGGNGPGVQIGGRFNVAASSWTPMSIAGAPRTRYWHTAIWTGNEMIIWGGYDTSSGALADQVPYTYAPSRVMYLYLRP